MSDTNETAKLVNLVSKSLWLFLQKYCQSSCKTFDILLASWLINDRPLRIIPNSMVFQFTCTYADMLTFAGDVTYTNQTG